MDHLHMLVAGCRGQGLQVQFRRGGDAGHDDACFVTAGHQGLENAAGIHAQLVGHGHGGKVAFVHIGLMQGEGDLQTLQQARGIGLGYFFAAHSACDKLVIETGDGVIRPASRP